jgi:hypothetical protein
MRFELTTLTLAIGSGRFRHSKPFYAIPRKIATYQTLVLIGPPKRLPWITPVYAPDCLPPAYPPMLQLHG